MSVELLKSLTYKDGKVFTRQCSNNVSPKDYISCEHTGLTKRYQELGKQGFEKWFINNCLISGSVQILDSSNGVLQKLKRITDHLYFTDNEFRFLRDSVDISYDKLSDIRYGKNKDGNEELALQRLRNDETKLEKYVDSIYDKFNSSKNKNER